MISTRLAFIAAVLMALPATRAASPTLPPFQEVYDLLRTNLVGMSTQDFEQNATRALLAHFAGQVLKADDAQADAEAPAIAQRTTYDKSYSYLRVGKVDGRLDQAIAEFVADTNALSQVRGLVLDLRFARGSDYAAAAAAAGRFVAPDQPLLDWGEGSARSAASTNAPWSLPVAVLINSRTAGAAEAFAAILREAGVALLIGGQTAGQAGLYKEFTLSNGERLRVAVASVKTGKGEAIPAKGLEPDIAVVTRPDHELAWISDPFMAVAAATNSPSATNKIVSSITVKKRLNEAELVRAQKAGRNPDIDLTTNAAAANRPVAATADSSAPSVRDPVLGRALDLLKGLSLIRGR